MTHTTTVLRLVSTASLLLATATAQLPPLNVTVHAQTGKVDFAPGVRETAWTYNGTLPGQPLRVTEGQPLRLRFINDLPQETTIHFHGQPQPIGMDGMSGISRPSVAPGQEFLYELDHLLPGTYWYHPHADTQMEQLNKGLYGVLIVDPANPNQDPPYDVDQVVVLDDWIQPFGPGYLGYLLNGKSNAGQAPIVVQQGQRLRLRFLNASAMAQYMVALDGHPMTVTHTDGNRVNPVTVDALPIGIGERYDVIVDCNNPGLWSLAVAQIDNRNSTLVRGIVQYAGQSGPPPSPTLVPTNLATGTVLSYSQLSSFTASLLTATPNRIQPASLGVITGPSMSTFLINNQAFPNVTPMPVTQGDVVQIDMLNTSMAGMMYHPMHLHGHSFRLMNTAGGMTNAPLKDTILIRPMGLPGDSWSVQFTADNPGRWMYHCHDMAHMMNGMIALFDYTGDADQDGLPDIGDMDPGIAHPVLTIPDVAAAFLPGGSGALSAQWRNGETVFFMASLLEAAAPVPMAPYGSLYLAPGSSTFLAWSIAQGSGYATLPYVLPNDPNLSGLRLCLQGVGTTNTAAGYVLSTYQAFTIH